MTPGDIYTHRQTLGLTLRQMAEMLGYKGRNAARQMRHLESGHRDLPEAHRRLLTAYVEGYRPADWPIGPKESIL